MTSKQTHERECFVYITLPRQTKSVVAGRFLIDKDRRGLDVGRFVYGRSYLANRDAVEIDPVELRLAQTAFQTYRLSGIFGALRDSGPDFWGRRVIEKHAGKAQLAEMDYLLESPDDRAGALGFGLGQNPPAPKRKFNRTLDLEQLQRIAEALIKNEIKDPDHDAVQVQDLILLGTSMGGARPKAVVEDDMGLWIAKFSRADDRWNNPKVEHAMLELARKCGINVARSRIEPVAGKDVLLVLRFDREKVTDGYIRARMISGLTLLRADDAVQVRTNWSYVLMAEEMRRVVAEPKKDALELFRRMCFNALISNLDDHPRNHALIAMDRPWRLSPAYDLTPSPVISKDRRDLAMNCGDLGRYANATNLLTQCSRFLLDRQEAEAVLDKLEEQVRTEWYNTCRSVGVSEEDAELIRSAFNYEGFRY